MWMIEKILSQCASFLFPTYCFVCKKEGSVGESICAPCLTLFPQPVDTPAPFITSLYSYKNHHVKKSIHAIKYFHRKDLILPYAQAIVHKIIEKDALSDAIIVPIPMPRLRSLIRGYNHSYALAKLVGSNTMFLVRTDILSINNKKKRKRQVLTKSRSERLQNQQNAFIVNTSVKNMHIILIDDVTTTGATLREAYALLKSHGARTVEAYTIAH